MVEPESKKSNFNDVLNWLSIVRNITPSFYSGSYNLHGPVWMALRKRGGGTFLNLHQKVKGGGVPRKGGVSSEKAGFQPWRKLCHSGISAMSERLKYFADTILLNTQVFLYGS